MTPGKKTALILCTGNSCRSQMAEALLRRSAGDLLRVESAGCDPAHFEGEAEVVKQEFRRVRDEIELVMTAYAAGLKESASLKLHPAV